MSLRFDERIARTYRREEWNAILERVLARSTDAAEKLMKRPEMIEQEQAKETTVKGSEDTFEQTDKSAATSQTNLAQEKSNRIAAKFLLERIALEGVGLSSKATRASDLLQRLVSMVLDAEESNPATQMTPTTIDSGSCHLPISCSAVFWRTAADLSISVPLQLHLSTPGLAGHLSELTFDSLDIYFSDQRVPVHITHQPSQKMVHRFNLGHLAPNGKQEEQKLTTNLSFSGASKVLFGTTTSAVAHSLQVTKIVLALRTKAFAINLSIACIASKMGSRWSAPPDKDGICESLALQTGVDWSTCR